MAVAKPEPAPMAIGKRRRRGSTPSADPDLPADAVDDWANEAPTGMESPAYATTKSLLLEIRQLAKTTAGMVRAINRFTLVAGGFLLLILAALVTIAAILWPAVAR